MNEYEKPVPVPDAISEPFWSGLKEGIFQLQQCADCLQHQFYPRAACTHCGSMDLNWVEASGLGTIHTFTVIHRTGVPGWRDEVPYVVALIDLDEGPRMQSNVVDCDPADVRVGSSVRADLREATPDVTLPVFVLVD